MISIKWQDHSPDLAALDAKVLQLDGALRAHAGGLELVEANPEGAVTVRFTGMCTGCSLRPLTASATVRPMLLEVDGVTQVVVQGSQVSEFAERRLARAFARDGAVWSP